MSEELVNTMNTISIKSIVAAIVLFGAARAQDGDSALARKTYRAEMAAAEASMRLAEHSEARAWLDATDPAQRGLEWRLFDAGFDDALARFEVESPVHTLAVSPDGARIALGRADGVVEVRDTQRFDLVVRKSLHQGGVTQLRWDRAGARLVSASHDRRVVVARAADLGIDCEFTQHGYPVGGADFAPSVTATVAPSESSPALVASCSYERPAGGVVGTLQLWNGADATLVRTLHGGRKPLVELAFSPDGRFVAAASWDFCAFVWPVEGGEPRVFAVPDEGVYRAVDGVAWSPDGSLLAVASKDVSARVFDVASGALLYTMRGHRDAVAKLAFSPDGDSIATASGDGTLALYSVRDGRRAAVLRGHSDAVHSVAYATDGTQLWSSSKDRSVRRWDARASVYDEAPLTASRATYVVRWSPIGDCLASASYDGRVTIWSAVTREKLASWQAHPADKSCHALAFSPDGRTLYSGSYDGTVAIWDSVLGLERGRLQHPSGVYWLAVSGDGALLAVASDKQVLVWDLAKREQIACFTGHSAAVLSVAFSPDATRCVSCARDGKALVFEARSGALVASFAGGAANVAEAVFTSRGDEVIVGGRDGSVARFDVASGRRLEDLLQSRHGFDHLALSPDGRRLVLASESLVFVDAQHGGIVGRFRGHKDRPYHVAFDARGERLASCSTDRSIVIYDPRSLRDRLAARARREQQRSAVREAIEQRLSEDVGLEEVTNTVWSDPAISGELRSAWVEELTLRAERSGR